MENKYLQVKKENVFTKFANFIKGLFGYKVLEEIQVEPTNIPEKADVRASFLEELRGEKEEDQKLIKLQNQFENEELDLCVMSNEQIESLNSLYKKQICDLEKKLDDKKTQLETIKKRINNYQTNN